MLLETTIIWLTLALLISVFRSLCMEKANRRVHSNAAGSTPSLPSESLQLPAQPHSHLILRNTRELYDWRRRAAPTQPRPDHLSRTSLGRSRSFQSLWVRSDIGTLHKSWRLAVAGLVTMAERNLRTARTELEAKLYMEAIRSAATSVENISRALLYCYGVEPYPFPGQEEALRLLASRINEDRRREFGKAIDKISPIIHIYTELETATAREPTRSAPDQEAAHSIVEKASEVVALFHEILDDAFRDEIPELHAFS